MVKKAGPTWNHHPVVHVRAANIKVKIIKLKTLRSYHVRETKIMHIQLTHLLVLPYLLTLLVESFNLPFRKKLLNVYEKMHFSKKVL